LCRKYLNFKSLERAANTSEIKLENVYTSPISKKILIIDKESEDLVDELRESISVASSGFRKEIIV
jgi:hypothetical protein